MRLVIRLLLGLTFILSGIFKLVSVDGFELFVFKALPLNWMLTTVFVRLLIALEIAIGLLYLAGIALKRTNLVALVLISGFSIWLIVQWLNGNSENCHCFGDLFQMDALESLLKNAIILVFIFLLYRLKGGDIISVFGRFNKWAVAAVLLISLLTPFIYSPPDFLVANRYDLNGVASDIKFEKLDSIQWRGTKSGIIITKGKNIVFFMSMACLMCQKAAKKISIVNSRYHNTLPVSFIFFGDSSNMKYFWEKSESSRFPYKIISSKQFFSITRQMPTIFFLNEGKVVKAMGYRNLNDSEIISFLKLE